MKKPIRYYREIESGDYVAVDHSTRDYYRRIGQPEIREARATAISGCPSSVCTTGVSIEWLHRKCRRVTKVPRIWKQMF